MSNRAIIEKELTQGVVPIGTPKAYQYDQALVESAKAEVRQGLTEANTILTAIRNEYGYPFTASSADAMTDQTKIYVYTGTTTASLTQGHWYYYNGSVWKNGGVYNAIAFITDKTLSISDDAADAKVTGDKIKNLQDGITNTLHSIQPVSTSFIDAVVQYCDNANNVGGEIWNYVSGDNVTTAVVAGYSRIPMFILPAGTYSVPLISMYASQSYIKDTTGITKFKDKFSTGSTFTGDFTLTEDTEMYISTGNSYQFVQLFNKNNILTITAQNYTNYINRGQYYAKFNGVKINASDVENLPGYDTTIYDQAFIKNCELTCNNDHLNANTSVAKYTEVDMGSNVKKVMCRGKFRTASNNASVTLIATALNTRANVQNVVQKSIHIGFNGVNCICETFDSGVRTAHGTYSYTITLDTEVEYGWSISGNTLTLYLPDGTTQTVTDEAFSASNGQYFIFEHFSYQTTATNPVTDEFGQPVITGIYAECDSGLPLRDNFKRANGIPFVAPTGHVYRQFRNTAADGNDTVYDNNGGQ